MSYKSSMLSDQGPRYKFPKISAILQKLLKNQPFLVELNIYHYFWIKVPYGASNKTNIDFLALFFGLPKNPASLAKNGWIFQVAQGFSVGMNLILINWTP